MKYRMIAIDLDDSLLNDDLGISEKNKRAVRYAKLIMVFCSYSNRPDAQVCDSLR